MSTAQRSRPRRTPPMFNRVMARLLRSRLSRLVEGGLMLLTVTGRRSGRAYTFPVQYVADDRVLWIYVCDQATKTWWRNLLGGGDVQVLLRRQAHAGAARALLPAEDPQAIAEGLRRYVDRFPSTAKRLGLPAGDPAALIDAAARSVMVHITLDEDGRGSEAMRRFSNGASRASARGRVAGPSSHSGPDVRALYAQSLFACHWPTGKARIYGQVGVTMSTDLRSSAASAPDPAEQPGGVAAVRVGLWAGWGTAGLSLTWLALFTVQLVALPSG